MANLKDLYIKCRKDPQFESIHVSIRPLRGPQAEIITRVEKHIAVHRGGVMPILSSRQTGKNEIAAVLQRLIYEGSSNRDPYWASYKNYGKLVVTGVISIAISQR
jgi:hypothetical protein